MDAGDRTTQEQLSRSQARRRLLHLSCQERSRAQQRVRSFRKEHLTQSSQRAQSQERKISTGNLGDTGSGEKEDISSESTEVQQEEFVALAYAGGHVNANDRTR
jgi:hypothetical protein